MIRKLLSTILVLLIGAEAYAADAPSTADRNAAGIILRVTGKEHATVTEQVIHLADIADISSPSINDTDSIVALRRITISNSPKPGESATIEGEDVLERLKDNGVGLDQVIYSLPKTMTVTRAYRDVTEAELEKAVASFFNLQGRQDLAIRSIETDKPIRVAPSAPSVEAVGLRATQPGHVGVDLKSGNGSDEVRFQLRAVVDEWRRVPVATRFMPKGSILAAGDVTLERMNVSGVTREIVDNLSDVLGHVLTREVGQGEAFSKSVLESIPDVQAGGSVTISYKSGSLEATASGVAIEAGAIGSEIRVRNESSKKIVRGRIIDSGLVQVFGGDLR